jgi:hypothetical protein
MKDGVKLWSKYGSLEVPMPEDVNARSLHVDTKKQEVRAYANGVQICKLDIEEAMQALNEAWRTREVDGKQLDDWKWIPETGEVE